MEHIGAGLAALGVFGPGIGIGILAGLSATAIGRNPDAAGQIRGIAIILAAFAEGLGVLAIVVGLLAIFIQPAREPSWTSWPSPPGRAATSSSSPRRRAASAVPDQPVLGDRRRAQLHPVLRDHLDVRLQARVARCWPTARRGSSRASRTPSRPGGTARTRKPNGSRRSAEARREANEILTRAQKVAQETRDADIAATREELERMRVRAAAEIEAEKKRAIGEVRAEVADLALAGRRARRRRDDDRRAPAAPRRGVPAHAPRAAETNN